MSYTSMQKAAIQSAKDTLFEHYLELNDQMRELSIRASNAGVLADILMDMSNGTTSVMRFALKKDSPLVQRMADSNNLFSWPYSVIPLIWIERFSDFRPLRSGFDTTHFLQENEILMSIESPSGEVRFPKV